MLFRKAWQLKFDDLCTRDSLCLSLPDALELLHLGCPKLLLVLRLYEEEATALWEVDPLKERLRDSYDVVVLHNVFDVGSQGHVLPLS